MTYVFNEDFIATATDGSHDQEQHYECMSVEELMIAAEGGDPTAQEFLDAILE